MTIVAVFLPLSLFAASGKGHEGILAMSFNIRNSESNDGTNSWQYRYPATAMMLDELKPDVIGIQEALLEQVDYFKTVMDKEYKIVGVGRDDGKKAGEISAIMYNNKTVSLAKWGTFWLSDTPDTPGPGWDASTSRSVTWASMKDKETGKKFVFVCVRMDGDGVDAQKNGIKLLADKLAEINPDGAPVILAGDLNMSLSDAAFAPLKAVLDDARTTAVVTDDTPSFNGWGKSSKTVDYILYKGASCTKFETITKAYYERNFISDHYPVLGTFVF